MVWVSVSLNPKPQTPNRVRGLGSCFCIFSVSFFLDLALGAARFVLGFLRRAKV